ncbi:MAG: hypothetical protein GY729_09445 [Desulfobacteraceae bacterium]|nr:hypothetical protein [Desulfobacteraceae bacterium]
MNKKANITVIGFPKILLHCRETAEEYLNSANFLYYQYDPEKIIPFRAGSKAKDICQQSYPQWVELEQGRGVACHLYT